MFLNLFAQIFVLSLSSFADITILRGGEVLSTPANSKWFPNKVTNESVKAAQFVHLKSQALEDASANFVPLSVGPAPAFTFAKRARRPVVPSVEGCAKHPMEWLNKAEVVGDLKEKLDPLSIHIEIPTGFKAVKFDSSFEKVFKAYLEAPDSSEDDDGSFKKRVTACMRTVKFFEKDKTKLAYVDCDDDLNDIEYIFIKENGAWATKEIESFTLTENCP